MIQSQRPDRRGHWPAGRRRNDQPPPAGWPSVDAFLSAVREYCRDHQQGAELARHLQVHPKTLRKWLYGVKWPRRQRLLQIARWYRAQRRSP